MEGMAVLAVSIVTAFGMWSCSDDDTISAALTEPLSFVSDSIAVDYTAGSATAVVESDGSHYRIEHSDNGVITAVRAVSGGSREGGRRFDKVRIEYAENASDEARQATLALIGADGKAKSSLTLTQKPKYETVDVTTDISITHQHVTGFGGMYNPSIWVAPADRISAGELERMYSPSGLGYNILRLMIYPDENRWADDVDGARRAQALGAIIFACPWDCGDERADKVTVNGKSLKHLRADKYADYADHLVRYVDFMRQNGVGIYAISVQNEPDMDFTYWSPAEIVDFTKRFGQKIRAAGTRLMGPESCEYNPDYTDAVLTDAEAMAQTDILAGHLYQGFLDTTQPYTAQRRKYVCGLYDNHLKAAGKTWWMTEHLFNDGQDKDNADDYLEFQKWTYSLNHLALEMHHCMEGNCSAYVYWYLKRFYGMIGDNDPERNTTPEGEPTKNGYIMAHYAKYAKGMDRIEASAVAPDLLVTAYANASRTEMTLVAINMGDGFRCLSIQLPSAEATAEAVETNDTVDMADAHAQVKGGKALVRMSGKGIVSVRIKM